MFASGLPLAARLLVWAIVLGGLIAFIWRRLQGVPLRGKPKTDTDSSSPSSAIQPVAPPVAMPLFPAATPAPEPGVLPPTEPPPSVVPPAAASPAGAVPATPAAAPGGPVPTAARSGFFAPSGDGPESSRPATTSSPGDNRPTVAEALQGVVMPCGLSPVVDGSSSLPNPFRVLFVTNLAAAPEVGRSLADELERLGFTLSTAAATELVGRRGRAELRVVLYPTASSARRGLEQLFPAAGPGAVGVELTT